MNIVAKKTVYTKPCKTPLLLPCIIEWWAYVTVTPEDNNIIVLSNGNSKGLIASIPIGGQCAPISTVGDNVLWKKAQNIPKKNNASDTINKAIPIFKPFCTAKVWLPKYVPSDITSLNQKDIENIKHKKPKIRTSLALIKPCIVKTPKQVNDNKDKLVFIGHGDGDTKWKGWNWKLLLVKFVILFVKFVVISVKFIVFVSIFFSLFFFLKKNNSI